MKKLLYSLFVAAILTGCANSRTIDSSRLEGRYNVDFQSILNDELDDIDDSEVATWARGAITMLANSLEININFDGDGKGVLEVNGWGINLVSDYLKFDLNKVNEFTYRIDNDSVLMTKNSKHDFEPAGVLRKLTDSYDSLQLVTTDGYTINLIKTAESEK